MDPRTRRLQRASDVERDARRTQPTQRRRLVLTAPEPNATLLGVLLCLPTAPALPPGHNGDFGMSPIYGQLSDKPLLAFASLIGVPDVKHNRDREIKRRAPSCRPGLRPPCGARALPRRLRRSGVRFEHLPIHRHFLEQQLSRFHCGYRLRIPPCGASWK